jgi:ornithine decarboxylase
LQNFPGDVAYAYKANSSVFLLGALYGAGLRHFDVASLRKSRTPRPSPSPVALHAPGQVALGNPACLRRVRRAQLRPRQREELKKIAEETGGCRDLTLWVRVPSRPKTARSRSSASMASPAPRPCACSARRVRRRRLGLTFHVGSQTATPDAFVTALSEIGRLIVKAGVVLDRLDVGGGFPPSTRTSAPAPLSAFVRAISDCVDRLPVGEHCRLMCEPAGPWWLRLNR